MNPDHSRDKSDVAADVAADVVAEKEAAERQRAKVELRHVEERIDGLQARMRTAVDLLGVLLLGLSGAALLVVSVLAIVGFVGNDTGIGLLFSGLAVICLPLVAFAAWRAFQPLWLLSRELTTLRSYEQQLRAKTGPPVPALPPRGLRGRQSSGRAPVVEQLPPGRSPTGWRALPPRKQVTDVLSTRQVSGRVAIVIGVLMLLFAAGVLTGVLARP